jgi:hypothetical protein
MCTHIDITHLVLNSAVRTNQRIVSPYGDVSHNAPVLHDMGICTASTVIRYVLRCLLLTLCLVVVESTVPYPKLFP